VLIVYLLAAICVVHLGNRLSSITFSTLVDGGGKSQVTRKKAPPKIARKSSIKINFVKRAMFQSLKCSN
jgi:hypothetical protein